MGKLAMIARRLKSANLEKAVLEIVREHEAQVIDLNLLQLDSGTDNAGKPLDPPYRSAKYADFKLTLNPKGVVDLKLTGDFWDGFFLSADQYPITFGSADIKAPELEAKYGKEIFGLDKTSMEALNKGIVLPELRARIRKVLLV